MPKSSCATTEGALDETLDDAGDIFGSEGCVIDFCSEMLLPVPFDTLETLDVVLEAGKEEKEVDRSCHAGGATGGL